MEVEVKEKENLKCKKENLKASVKLCEITPVLVIVTFYAL